MATEVKGGLWLGGITGRFLNASECDQYPAIVKLGQKFHDFQNSPYRGEWEQNCPAMTMGEVRDLLVEVSRLIPSPSERCWRDSQPSREGWWLWKEGGTAREVRLLLRGNGRIVASDDELSQVLGREVGEDENYWEGTETDSRSMPGLWAFDCTG